MAAAIPSIRVGEEFTINLTPELCKQLGIDINFADLSAGAQLQCRVVLKTNDSIPKATEILKVQSGSSQSNSEAKELMAVVGDFEKLLSYVHTDKTNSPFKGYYDAISGKPITATFDQISHLTFTVNDKVCQIQFHGVTKRDDITVYLFVQDAMNCYRSLQKIVSNLEFLKERNPKYKFDPYMGITYSFKIGAYFVCGARIQESKIEEARKQANANTSTTTSTAQADSKESKDES